MKGKEWALALAALLCAKTLGLLPQSRELEEWKLVTALALDREGETVTATALTGVRTTEEEEPETFTGEGGGLAEACAALRQNSSRRAYLGQTQQLLLGEGQDLGAAMDFVLLSREVRTDTLLYIVKGTAGAALMASADKVGAETGGQDPRGRTVGELLPRLSEGEYTLTPALAPGEGGALAPAGWAVLGPKGVEGWLEGDAALGADLLTGLGTDKTVTLPTGAVQLTAVRLWAKEGTLRCSLTARVAQGDPRASDLEGWGEEKLKAALEPGWDCWGLRRQLAALEPRAWEEWQGADISALNVEVTGRLVGDREGG